MDDSEPQLLTPARARQGESLGIAMLEPFREAYAVIGGVGLLAHDGDRKASERSESLQLLQKLVTHHAESGHHEPCPSPGRGKRTRFTGPSAGVRTLELSRHGSPFRLAISSCRLSWNWSKGIVGRNTTKYEH